MSVVAKYRKAFGSLLGPVVGLGGAVLALGVLSGPASHDLAVALAASTPVLTFLGTAVTKPNAGGVVVQSPQEKALASMTVADLHALHDTWLAAKALFAEAETSAAVGAPTPAVEVATPAIEAVGTN